MLTVQQLKPTITDIKDLIKSGEYVGYRKGSFVEGLLKRLDFDSSKFKNYSTSEEYDKALSRGSRNGGVGAIVDEVPYIKLFLAKYCTKYTMVRLTSKTAGISKGISPSTDVSRAILSVAEGEQLSSLQREWFREVANCTEQDGTIVTSSSLTIESFKGLFLIASLSSSCALILSLCLFLYENRDILASNDSIRQKLVAMAKSFDEEKESLSDASKKKKATNEGTALAATATAVVLPQDIAPADCPQSSRINVFSHHAGGIFSQDEGFSTTEPGTPLHDAIEMVEINEALKALPP